MWYMPGTLLSSGAVKNNSLVTYYYCIITLVMTRSASLSPPLDCIFLEKKNSFFVSSQHCSCIIMTQTIFKGRKPFWKLIHIYSWILRFPQIKWNQERAHFLFLFSFFITLFLKYLRTPENLEPFLAKISVSKENAQIEL